MIPPELIVHENAQVLAEDTAARLITRIVDVQAANGEASVVLTGGTIGIAVLAAVADSPARDAVDWRALDIWWGDERFLPSGHPDRNETQARAALLDHVEVDPQRVRAMPADEGEYADDPEGAAALYAEWLAGRSAAHRAFPVPPFDVVLLGVGPDTHVASLFPEHPATRESERSVVAVHGAPKPPPTRISLTFPALQCGQDVWLLVAGAEKADAVRLASEPAGQVQVPVAGARGVVRTLLLTDSAAASGVLGRGRTGTGH